MTYRITHCQYHRLDPAKVPEPALFFVYKDEHRMAVVREPCGVPLIGEPVADANYRVDCRTADDELKALLRKYFPGRTFAYFEDASWTWRDNGTYEEMPWGDGRV